VTQKGPQKADHPKGDLNTHTGRTPNPHLVIAESATSRGQAREGVGDPPAGGLEGRVNNGKKRNVQRKNDKLRTKENAG